MWKNNLTCEWHHLMGWGHGLTKKESKLSAGISVSTSWLDVTKPLVIQAPWTVTTDCEPKSTLPSLSLSCLVFVTAVTETTDSQWSLVHLLQTRLKLQGKSQIASDKWSLPWMLSVCLSLCVSFSVSLSVSLKAQMRHKIRRAVKP